MAVTPDGGSGVGSSDRWWPGLEVPDAVSRMDPDAVEAVAANLEGMWNRLTDSSKGTLRDLADRSSIVTTNDAFGRWETARELHDSYQQARDRTLECYQMIIEQLAMAVDALRGEVADLKGVDIEAAGLLSNTAAASME